MTREEQKDNTAFNHMVKRYSDALVEDATTPPPVKQFTEDQLYASKRFGILPEDVLWYHCGSCYDRVGVLTKDAADQVAIRVEGQTANGGMFHGMPLGGATKYTNEQGIEYWDVYC